MVMTNLLLSESPALDFDSSSIIHSTARYARRHLLYSVRRLEILLSSSPLLLLPQPIPLFVIRTILAPLLPKPVLVPVHGVATYLCDLSIQYSYLVFMFIVSRNISCSSLSRSDCRHQFLLCFHGKPLVCFSNTSSISETLSKFWNLKLSAQRFKALPARRNPTNNIGRKLPMDDAYSRSRFATASLLRSVFFLLSIVMYNADLFSLFRASRSSRSFSVLKCVRASFSRTLRITAEFAVTARFRVLSVISRSLTNSGL